MYHIAPVIKFSNPSVVICAAAKLAGTMNANRKVTGARKDLYLYLIFPLQHFYFPALLFLKSH
jgi:hypothetical protein